jgi:hypothetical protein
MAEAMYTPVLINERGDEIRVAAMLIDNPELQLAMARAAWEAQARLILEGSDRKDET